MAIKLRSLFQGRALALALKAAVFTTLLLAASYGGSFFYILYWAGSLTLFISPWASARRHLISFFAITGLSPVMLAAAPAALGRSILALAAGAVFAVLLCLKDFLFVRRGEWSHVLLVVFIFALSALYLSADRSEDFLLKTAGIFIAVSFLSRELLIAYEARERLQAQNSAVNPALAALSGLVITEAIWAISVLPAEPLLGASLAALVGFGFTEPVRREVEGSLSNRSALAALTVFIALAVFIFAAVRWNI